MKIHQLTNGARFEYEGEEYVKTGPLLGSGKHGQRLIPRYAVLKPLGKTETAQATTKDAVSKKAVLLAFDRFLEDCKAQLSPEQQAVLEASRDRFLKALG